MTIPTSAIPKFRGVLDKIGTDLVLVILMGFDSDADGHFVWDFIDKQQFAAITKSDGSTGAKLGGSFMGFVPNQLSDNTHIVEDGFFIMLSNDSWHSLRQAITNGQDAKIASGEGGLNFLVHFVKSEWVNPVDGMVHVAERGWANFVPEESTPSTKPKKDVSLSRIQLLSSDQEMMAAVSVNDFSDYIAMISDEVVKVLKTKQKAQEYELVVQFAVATAQQPILKLVTTPQNQLSAEEQEEIGNTLKKQASSLEVKGPIKYQLYFFCPSSH